MAEGDSAAAELQVSDVLQGLARHINCLADGTRFTKKKALVEIRKQTLERQPSLPGEVLQQVLGQLLKPVLKSFSDSIEACRELAISFVGDALDHLRLEDSLPYIMPTAVQRLGTPEIVESAEELRLLLVQTLSKIVRLSGKLLGPYVDDLVKILERTLVDPFPEVKRQSCSCTSLLAKAVPEHFHLQSPQLIKPLLLTISHQHAKVRLACVQTIGDVLQHGSHKPMEDVISHMAQRLFDHAPQVRAAVTQVVGQWLLDFVDRYSFHHRLIPLLLSSVTDELPDIREQANRLWDQVGKKYEEENEEELKDKMDFAKIDVALPPGYENRPNLGCRILVYHHLSKILPGLLRDLTDWNLSNRLMSARLLHTLLLNAEDNTTQHLEKLVGALSKACLDEEQQVASMVLKSAELVGWFVDPKVWCGLILPIMKSGQSVGMTMLLASTIRGAQKKALRPLLAPVCDCLSSPDVCHSQDLPYQTQLCCCVDVILDTCQEDSCQFSLQLFTVLLAVLSFIEEEACRHQAGLVMDKLARIQGMQDSGQLYQAHIKATLDWLQANHQEWTNYSPERAIFDTLLSRGGSSVGYHLDQIIPIFKSSLSPDRHPELRLKFFSLLSRLVMSAQTTLDSHHQFSQFTLTVIEDMVLPNCVWAGGRTAAAIRTVAVSCLWALVQSEKLTQEQVMGIMGKLYPQLVSLLDDDNQSTRLAACKVLRQLFLLCGQALDPDQVLHKVYMELLKRLDDSSDQVRLACARAFAAYFGCFRPDYNRGLYKAHMEAIYRGILVHLDDPEPAIQQAILDLLKASAHVHPSLLLKEIDTVQHRHRSTKYLNELTEFTKKL